MQPTIHYAHLPTGVVERCGLQIVDGVDRSSPRHQHPYDVEVTLLTRPVQRGIIVAVPLIHVPSIINVLQQSIQITLRKTASAFCVSTSITPVSKRWKMAGR